MLQFMGSQRVRHNTATKQQHYKLSITCPGRQQNAIPILSIQASAGKILSRTLQRGLIFELQETVEV